MTTTTTMTREEVAELEAKGQPRSILWMFHPSTKGQADAIHLVLEAIGNDMLSGGYTGPAELDEADEQLARIFIYRSTGEEVEEPLPLMALEAARMLLRTGLTPSFQRQAWTRHDDAPEDTIVIRGNCHAIGQIARLAAADGLNVTNVERDKS